MVRSLLHTTKDEEFAKLFARIEKYEGISDHMKMTLSATIILVSVTALALACIAMAVAFNLAAADALPDGATLNALLTGGGFTVLLAVAGALFICSRLCPIRQCVAYAQAVAAGDEKATLEVYRSDCLGHLAQALRNMVTKLEGQAHWYESILDTLPLSVSVTDNDMRTA